MHRFAVIADPHYFDLFADYAPGGIDLGGRSGGRVHTLADSAVSTRLFNEGFYALPAALDLCVREGVRNVVVTGDLSDDGQRSAMAGAVALLERYEREHGLRFFLTPGNHDAYGMSGRDITRRLLESDGGFLTLSSAEGADASHRLEAGQRCLTYPELLESWAGLGLKRRPEDLHWESPFGTDDRAEARMFAMTAPGGTTVHRQLDLSYLVEPEPGLWLLSIDANVFVPREGRLDNTLSDAFEDSTSAGWREIAIHKPFLLDWMADVARRAARDGKTLLCFSHYPVVDVLDGTAELERALLGNTMSVRRTPSQALSKRICATGVHTHFSGHMHVYDRSSVEADGRVLTNHAIPSIVAFPALVGIVEADGERVRIGFETLDFDDYRALYAPYGVEAARTGLHADWLEASTYGDFVHGQIAQQVLHAIVPRQWPQPLAAFVADADLGDVRELASRSEPLHAWEPRGTNGDISMRQFAIDLHTMRVGSEAALDYVPQERANAYRDALRLFDGVSTQDAGSLQAQVKTVLAMFDRFAAKGHEVEAIARKE